MNRLQQVQVHVLPHSNEAVVPDAAAGAGANDNVPVAEAKADDAQ